MTQSAGTEKEQINSRLFGLDHLRALAIILVFVFHYGRLFPHPDWTNSISKFGWTGVDLFFVLSGYLITSQLFLQIARNKQISFKAFFIKRFFRIIPAYFFVVALYFLFPSFREREGLAPLWKYVTFTQNFGLDLHHQGTFSHAWSLCIEEQFYLLMPLTLITLVYFKAIKKGFLLLLLLFAGSFLARSYAWHSIAPFIENDDFGVLWYKWIYYPTFCRLDGLLVGVSIAGIFQFYPKLKLQVLQHGNLLLVASLLILTIAYFLCLDQETFSASIFGFPLVSLGYGLMVAGAICPTSFLYKFNSKTTTTIATLSYSIYLSHKIIIHLTQNYLSKLTVAKESNLMFLVCIITSLAGAWLMNKIIEKSFLQLRDRLVQRR